MRLVDANAPDLAWIGAVTEVWSSTQRWSLRGRTPSPAMLEALLYDSVVLQRVAWADDDRPVAVLQLVDVEMDSGYGHLALLANHARPDDVKAAVATFLTVVFQGAALRKLCLAAHTDELDVATIVGDVAEQVGCLAGHERRGPTYYVDLLLYEIWRESVLH